MNVMSGRQTVDTVGVGRGRGCIVPGSHFTDFSPIRRHKNQNGTMSETKIEEGERLLVAET